MSEKRLYYRNERRFSIFSSLSNIRHTLTADIATMAYTQRLYIYQYVIVTGQISRVKFYSRSYKNYSLVPI